MQFVKNVAQIMTSGTATANNYTAASSEIDTRAALDVCIGYSCIIGAGNRIRIDLFYGSTSGFTINTYDRPFISYITPASRSGSVAQKGVFPVPCPPGYIKAKVYNMAGTSISNQNLYSIVQGLE